MIHLLPPELLMTITDNLPLIDRVSLALVSKTTHSTIGPKHLWNLRETHEVQTYFHNRQLARQVQAAEDAKARIDNPTTTTPSHGIVANQTVNQIVNETETSTIEEPPIPNTRKEWLLRLQKDMCGSVYCAECDVIHSLDFEQKVVGNGRKCFVRIGLPYGGWKRKAVYELDWKRKVLRRGRGVWSGRLRKR